ncbi:MAG: hypothetical protein WDM70_03875 [Nitrosomonadales bacterium]
MMGKQGKVLGEFAVKNLVAKKIAVLDDRTAYGQGLADEFINSAQASGAQIVAHEYTTDKGSGFYCRADFHQGQETRSGVLRRYGSTGRPRCSSN